MLRRLVTRILSLWACLGLAAQASACSPARGARIETNLELVARAPTILIGRVVRWDYEKSPDSQYYVDSNILVEPVIPLKGNAPVQPFRLEGEFALQGEELFPGANQPSRYDEFNQPHVGALGGGCERSNFVIGRLVVFFLQPKEGGWTSAGSIFSRWAEDVPSVDGPWVKLVRIYVQASQLPKGQRHTFLRAERDKLLAGEPGRIERLMADDIERQMKGKRRRLF